MDYLTLRELTFLIKSTIDSTLPDEYWVTAEVSQISCHLNSGHCYMEIVEKQENSTAAKMRANIWARDFRQISVNFRNVTGQELQAGMKILMLAREGIIDRNRSLSLPPVLQNIAVISSAIAAGYGDFINRLDNNLYGYKFS